MHSPCFKDPYRADSYSNLTLYIYFIVAYIRQRHVNVTIVWHRPWVETTWEPFGKRLPSGDITRGASRKLYRIWTWGGKWGDQGAWERAGTKNIGEKKPRGLTIRSPATNLSDQFLYLHSQNFYFGLILISVPFKINSTEMANIKDKKF